MFENVTLHTFIEYLAIFFIGACVGSFLNVCIHRLPRKRSVVRPGSSCPRCGHRLEWWENIPFVSYILLFGKCRSCGLPISFRYPAVELLTAVLGLVLWHKYGPGTELIAYSFFTAVLIIVTFIDLEHQIIPDILTLPGILLGFILSFFMSSITWQESVLGILIGGGSLYLVAFLYYLAAKREGMGGGDIKLLAMIGSFLGWQAIPSVIFISALAGSVVGFIVMGIKKVGSDTAIPYGPFLAVAALVNLFLGEHLVRLYFKIISFG